MAETSISKVVLLAALLALSAFFAGTEIAFFSLTKIQIERLCKKWSLAGNRIEALLLKPKKLLVTIYIGNELVNVAISAVATLISLELFGSIGLAVSLGAGTFLLLVLGEITPKSIAMKYNENWAVIAAYPLAFFVVVLWPIEVIVTAVSNLGLRLLGHKGDFDKWLIGEEELKSIVGEGAEEGLIDEGEAELIQNVFEFGDAVVSDVMTLRSEIMALEIDTPIEAAWKTLVDSKYARAPLYSGKRDNITGMVYKKDLLKYDFPPPPGLTLKDISRGVYLVSETMAAEELLREFKNRKTHIAVALDEYGQVTGIVTMDDIIGELVGVDKSSSAQTGLFEKNGENGFKIMAGMEIEDFNDLMATSIKHDDVETVGGYVFHLFGSLPMEGEKTSDGLCNYTVTKIEDRRISELMVEKIIPADKPEGTA